MALRNDPRMYSAGAVVLDSTPSVNLYAQLMSRKQAKMDALDEYDRHRINNINPNGVRDVDREGLDQRIKQIQEFYQGNKDKIRKGGTPESYGYEKMFRDVGSYINQSKERTAKQEAAMKLYQERLKQDGRIPDDFITELNENDSGIDKLTGVDPTGQVKKSKSLDLTKWLSQPKPFNQQTYLKGFGDIKRGQPTYEAIPNQPLKLNEVTSFDKEALQTIHARAADKYQNSFSFAEQVKTEFADPVGRKKMEDVFVQQFGTNPKIPEDYATAFTLELLQPKLSKPIDNKEAIINKNQQFSKEQQARSHQNSIERLYAYASVQDRKPENVGRNIDSLIGTHISDARGNNGEVLVDNTTFEALTGKKKSINSVLTIDEQGNYQYGVKDDAGKVEGALTPIPYELAKTKLTQKYKAGLDSKYNTGGGKPNVPAATNSKYKIKGKDYTEAELIKMGYTKDQIKPYKQ